MAGGYAAISRARQADFAGRNADRPPVRGDSLFREVDQEIQRRFERTGTLVGEVQDD